MHMSNAISFYFSVMDFISTLPPAEKRVVVNLEHPNQMVTWENRDIPYLLTTNEAGEPLIHFTCSMLSSVPVSSRNFTESLFSSLNVKFVEYFDLEPMGSIDYMAYVISKMFVNQPLPVTVFVYDQLDSNGRFSKDSSEIHIQQNSLFALNRWHPHIAKQVMEKCADKYGVYFIVKS